MDLGPWVFITQFIRGHVWVSGSQSVLTHHVAFLRNQDGVQHGGRHFLTTQKA